MSKKIIAFACSDISRDARAQRTAAALSAKYEVTVISKDCGVSLPVTSYKNYLIGKGIFTRKNYFPTIYKAYKIIKKERPDIFYGHDFFSSLLVKILLRRKYCRKVIYDAHELYIPQPGRSLPRGHYFFYLIEKTIVKKVDLLLCANSERAEKMAEHYGLEKRPIPIRNISQLQINDDETTRGILDSLKDFFERPGMTVVYAGVVSAERKVDKLVQEVGSCPDKYKLLIIGTGSALDSVKEIAGRYPSLTCAFTGPIPHDSLGALLSRCDVGYIYYPTNTLNTLYCASNKVYEYASVGLPMLSNENPTIKNALETHEMGIASNDIVQGLQQLSGHLDTYRENCLKFSKENPWSQEAEKLLNAIEKLS